MLNHQCDLITSNLTQNLARLPYRDNIFDLIITDLPFEKNHPVKFFDSSEAELKSGFFYRCVLEEFNRILDKKKGVLVVLINFDDITVFEKVYSEVLDGFLKIETTAKLSLGQTTAQMFKFTR